MLLVCAFKDPWLLVVVEKVMLVVRYEMLHFELFACHPVDEIHIMILMQSIPRTACDKIMLFEERYAK